MDLVTIVVPVYNVEKFLNRCIVSLINQTYHDIEILLIDDGSKDSSALLCDEWAKKDERIRVIHKENQGLGMARNTGIENASGKYICFCDSDDRIHPDTIGTCVEIIDKESADIVNFGFNYVSSNDEITKIRKPYQYNIFERDDIENVFLPQLMGKLTSDGKETGFCMSSCASLYRMSIIKQNDWRFVSEREIISEDFFSLLQLYKYVKKVITIPQAFYFYYNNQNSLTHTFREDRLEKNAIFYNRTHEVIKNLNYNTDVALSFNNLYLGNCIAALKQIANSDLDFKIKYKLLKKAIRDETLLKAIDITQPSASLQRKILFLLIQNKFTIITYLLLKLKS